MRVIALSPEVGLRCRLRLPGVAESIYLITAVSKPKYTREGRQVTLLPQLGGKPFDLSYNAFASHLLAGELIVEDWESPEPPSQPPGQLAMLVDVMTEHQRARFAMRLAYVQAVDASSVGLSLKSRGFRDLCTELFHVRRKEFAHRQASLKAGERLPFMETKPPSPHSVYRWLLRFRKGMRNPLVLAQEVLAVRTRRHRKEASIRLAEAFIKAKSSVIEATTVKRMHAELNTRLARLNPFAVDEEVARLAAEAKRNAERNRAMRKRRGMRAPKRGTR